MRKFVNVTLLLCLLVSFSLPTLTFVNAQEGNLSITVAPDGSFEPNTALLERNGNIYTFKGDISGTLDVHANNIIIDGAGYTLNGGILLSANHRPYTVADYEHATGCCLNVVVKNLKISNGGITSGAGGKNYAFIGNYFENSRIRFIGNADAGEDIFTHNTFVNVIFDFTYGGGNLVVMTENNLVNVAMIAFGTYFPKLDGNYYGDYIMRYPYATRIAGLGVWDTPYVMPIEEPGEPKACAIDSQPLVNPVTGFEVPHFNGPLPLANKPSPSIDRGSSSTGASTKTPMPNINTEISSANTDAETAIDSISDNTLSSGSTPNTSFNFGMFALIVSVLATIAAVPTVIILAIKKRNK